MCVCFYLESLVSLLDAQAEFLKQRVSLLRWILQQLTVVLIESKKSVHTSSRVENRITTTCVCVCLGLGVIKTLKVEPEHLVQRSMCGPKSLSVYLLGFLLNMYHI